MKSFSIHKTLVLITLAVVLLVSMYRDVKNIPAMPGDMRNRIVGSRIMKDGGSPYFAIWKEGDTVRYYDTHIPPNSVMALATSTPFFHHVNGLIADLPQYQPNVGWQPIKNIAWACDYKNINKATPVWSIKPLLQATGAKLHVVHNDPEHKQSAETLAAGQQKITEWFAGTDVTFALLEEQELKEAINHYVLANQIDMLIAIPKKHGWLEGLFSPSHTKQLAFSAHVPVLCVQAVAS